MDWMLAPQYNNVQFSRREDVMTVGLLSKGVCVYLLAVSSHFHKRTEKQEVFVVMSS